MSTADLEARVEQLMPRVAAVCRTLRDEVQRLGFSADEISIGAPDDAAYWLDRDPASGEPSLMGEWRDAAGAKVGTMSFHADGTFFVEHDVVRTHPSKPRFFVEAVTAWGRNDTIKSEPRLLPMVS